MLNSTRHSPEGLLPRTIDIDNYTNENTDKDQPRNAASASPPLEPPTTENELPPPENDLPSTELPPPILRASRSKRSLSVINVAHIMHVNKITVQRIKNKWETDGTVYKRKPTGRRKITTEAEDNALVQYLEQNPFHVMRAAIQRTDFPGSRPTACRRIKESPLQIYLATKKMILGNEHKQPRIIFALNNILRETWDRVILTDEKMPKVKKNRKYTKSYTEAILQQALSKIKAGEPKKKVAVRYGMPRSTLQFRLGPNFSKTELGHHIYLSKDDENKLVEWILESHRKGFPRRKLDIQLSVKSFMEANKRPNPFRENTPGDQWYKLFLNRHPVLTERTPEGVTAASANVSEENIKGWFAEVESYLKEKRYFSILEDPSRVYNGDETCFQFCPKLGKVIAPKGAKNIYEVDRGEAKQNLTVMFTFSSVGETTPPLIIFLNKRLPKNVLNSVPDGWGIGMSDNGWMKSVQPDKIIVNENIVSKEAIRDKNVIESEEY
ncbi:hypothetical protein MML48_9g00000314 [Holotrichia oblita]|uniref:Uncharacterized protein n=1 Tax=Holotrichia oblita TaxID=644536 RepID=A0ACB9SMN0_HOLOL|nr:hypothetical protein MML48_9g00000314 [Holotrichia oblita]